MTDLRFAASVAASIAAASVAISLLASGGCDYPASREAARVQNADGERGCALPGEARVLACDGDDCLVCYAIVSVPADSRGALPPSSVCVTLRMQDCR